MISKTRMLSLVREFRWTDVREAIGENPELIGFRDKKGRNWLHLCCGVNIKKRRLKAGDSIKTAEVLLNAGFDINQGRSAKEHGRRRHSGIRLRLARILHCLNIY